MSSYKVTCQFTFKNAKAFAATFAELDTAFAGLTVGHISLDGFPEPDGGMNKYFCEAVVQMTGDTITAVATAAQTLFTSVGTTPEIDTLDIDAMVAYPAHTHTKSEITDFPTLATVATSGLSADLTDIASTVTEAGTTAVTSAGIYAAIHAE